MASQSKAAGRIAPSARARSERGHEDPFPRPRLSDCYRFRKRSVTAAGRGGRAYNRRKDALANRPERGLKFSPPRKVEASPEVPRHILLVGQESPASNTCSRPRASFAHAGYD